MCGIFGMVRVADDSEPAQASRVFAALGHLAQQRGRDAAGFAPVTHRSAPTAPTAPLDASCRREVQFGGCLVVKDTRQWDDVWHPRYLPALDEAAVALGHTRHASQGASEALGNAAPLVAGAGLITTHNGDIDVGDLLGRLPYGLPTRQGDTDTEVLCLALDRVRDDLSAVCGVLSAMRGLAALAWVDRARPHRVFLARAALCPLAVARDGFGNLYWASSQAWFRVLDEQSGGRLNLRVALVREGVLLPVATGEVPTVAAERSFTPVARPGDEQRFPSIWAGLDACDVAAFRAEGRHRIADVFDRAQRPPSAAATAPTREGVTDHEQGRVDRADTGGRRPPGPAGDRRRRVHPRG
jgi:Glutamine amidotransferase domain